jgi:SH3 domain-containing YSC84-like protein 1
MMALEGTSFGLQAGGQARDFVFLLVNSRAAGAILSREVKLGVGGRLRCGGSARSRLRGGAVSMRAEILSYSRARGLFAGISLAGSTLRADNRANQNLDKKHLDAKAIVLKGEVATPPAAERLLATPSTDSPLRKRVGRPAAAVQPLGFDVAKCSKRVNNLRHTKGANYEYGRCFSSSCFRNS